MNVKPSLEDGMRNLRVSAEKGNVSARKHVVAGLFSVARQPDGLAPRLKRRNCCPHMIVNAVAESAETGNRMRSLPALMQNASNLKPISRTKPRPGERPIAFGQSRGDERDMPVSASSERKIARHNQSR